jgi:AI-2 transport protein TqsA
LHFSLVPLIEFQQKRLKIRRWFAIANTALIGAIVLLLLWLLIATTITQMVSNVEGYGDKIAGLVESGIDRLPLDRFGVTEEEVQALVSDPWEAVRGLVPGTVSMAIGLVSQGALVFLFLMFMIVGKGVTRRGSGGKLMGEVEDRVNRYVLTKFMLSALTGLVTWLILVILGVEFALVFGVMAFLLNFIPNIGSIIAGLMPVPVLLLGDYSTVTIILAILLPMGGQFCIGNLIEPKVMGKSLGMHPVVVLLSLVLFGLLWGIPGMFLAVPMAAILKIIMNKRSFTEPVARLMEGDLSVLESGRKEES